jgi:flagellar basal-body rod protein FlgG
MYNLQAITNRCINNSTVQFDKIGYIAANLSNYSTVGYKCVDFEQYLEGNGMINGTFRRNTLQGSVRASSNPFDIALTGQGYIPVVSEQGEVQYTRDGSMKIGKGGYLVTVDGWMVGDGIKIPPNSYKIEIMPNGDVMNYDKLGSLPEKIGTIPVVLFDNPEALEKGHNNKLKSNEDTGEAHLAKNTESIKQYATEVSNVNIYDELNNMMRVNASMIAGLTLAKVANDMYSKSINLQQ